MHLEEDSVLNWDSNKLEIREKLSGSAVCCIFHSISKTAHMWRSVAVSFPDQNYSQCSICALLTSGHTVLSIFEPIACYLSHESFQIYNSMAKGEANSEPVVLTIHRVSGP